MKTINQSLLAGLIITGGVSLLPFSSVAQEKSEIAPTDSIYADPIMKDLDDFVVTVRKEVLKTDGANISYNLEEDDTSKGQSVLDALKKIPLITVDAQDNIYIKGDSNFKIYVNGKEDPMLKANASTILKSMPSDAVSKIEVITEPGAKYDAEGSAGILNLITEKKQRKDGYAGSIEANFSSQSYGGNLFGSVKVGNFNADASLTYAENTGLWQENRSHAITEYDNPARELGKKIEEAAQKIGFRFGMASLNMSWQPSSNNLFTWGGSWRGLNGNLKEISSETSGYDRAGKLLWRVFQAMDGSLDNQGAAANASWRHNFDSEGGHRIIAAYAFNFGLNELNTTSENSTIDYIQSDFTGIHAANYEREHTAQVDYANPFGGEKHLMEVGVKGIFRRNSSDSFNKMGNSGGDLLKVPESEVVTDQNQDILAVYASYTGHYGNWNTVAGVRFEHTISGMTFHEGDYENFKRHLNDLVPNASVSYSFSPAHTIRLAYQMRITRPSISDLNPFTYSIQDTQVKMGNPDLKSEHHNRVSLSYSNYGRVFGGNLSFEYTHSTNSINQYVYMIDEIEYQTTANIGHQDDFRLNGFLNIAISNKMTLNLNGSVYYTMLRAPRIGAANQGWSGNYGAHWSYTGPGDVKFGVYGGQSFRFININGYWGGWYYYGSGISRDFLKSKKLNIALNASNFLCKNTHSGGKERGEGWVSRSSWSQRSWSLGVSLTWSFGHLTEKAKQSGIDLTNSDTSSSGQGKQGGGIGL
ncbi:MAG: TonB-dependent receptor [Muribaculaceae bacterium]|nr:TonB-dependent receptor [Muribaculaceae bacterium]